MGRPAPALRFGTVTLVPGERLLLRDGQPVALTPKAFDLLVHFARHPGRLLTKDDLLSTIWPDVVVEESNLAYHVFAIRKAVGDTVDGEPLIETVPKQGYRFLATVTSDQETGDSANSQGPVATTEPNRTSAGVNSWMFAAGCGLVVGAVAMASFDRVGMAPSSPATPIRLEEPSWNRMGATSGAGAWHAMPATFQISPDAQHLAVTTPGDDGVIRVWLRAMGALAPRPLPGTETPFPSPLIWSPDSRTIAYDATGSGALRKASLDGGAPQAVCNLNATAVGGSWNRDGVIIVGNPAGGILRCAAEGGTPAPVTRAAGSELHLFPSFLADGRRFVYLRISRTTPERSGVYVSTLDGNPAAERRLFTSGFPATYVRATDRGPGVLVLARDGVLVAQRLDEQRLQLVGEPVQLASNVGSFLDYAYFSASETTLVYREPEAPFQLTWFDRSGVERDRIGPAEHLTGLALSPDNRLVLVVRHAPGSTADQDLWLHDLVRRSYQRATSAPMLEFQPVWVSHGRFLYSSGGGGVGIYEQAPGTDPRLLFETDTWDVATGASDDGRLIFYTRPSEPQMHTDVWLRDNRTTAGQGVRLISGKFNQGQARGSPDGRLVAYVSNESGVNEVLVGALHIEPETGAYTLRDVAPASRGGGFAPRWRADGRELFYLKTDGSVMALTVNVEHVLTAGAAERVFTVPGVIPEWDVSRDGRRFLFAVPTAPPAPLKVINNWQSLLPK